MHYSLSQTAQFPTVNFKMIDEWVDDRSPFTKLALHAESEHREVIRQALEIEPMLTAEVAPAGIPVRGLTRHIDALHALGHSIHIKVLGWREIGGRDRRTTYYGLHRKLEKKFFTWGFERSLLQAFDDLEVFCTGVGFDINPQKRNLTVPEKLHLYKFLQSMAE